MKGRIKFPHSLGMFYQAMTQYLGFWKYGDEYKVMGLAPYGQPVFEKQVSELVSVDHEGVCYELNMDYFCFHKEKVEYTWEGGSPSVGQLFDTPKLEELLGPPGAAGEKPTQRIMDLAASTQLVYEKVVIDYLSSIIRETEATNLCLSGGCAMNSVANGKLRSALDLNSVYIPAAAGDAGGATGTMGLMTKGDKIAKAGQHTLVQSIAERR